MLLRELKKYKTIQNIIYIKEYNPILNHWSKIVLHNAYNTTLWPD